MRSGGSVVETVLVVVVLGLVLGATVPASAATAQTGTPTADNTVTRVRVHADGSATWTVRVRTRLDTEARLAEYQTFQDRFRENRSRYLDPFRERISGVVANAADLTDREMRAAEFSASTTVQELPRRWGIVTYRFTWTNFSKRQNDTLVVGDVFQGGFYLAPNDSLEVEPPAGYELVAVAPEPDGADSNALTWVGREDFSDGRPRIAFAASADSTATPTGTALPATGGGLDGGTNEGGSDGVLFGGVALVVAAVGAYAFRRRREQTVGESSAVGRESSQPDTSDAEKTGFEGEADAPEAGEGTPTTAADTDSAAPDSSDEILTDAERVQRILAADGGRMRQADIGDELDWSASKVSRTLAEMVEDGTVEKLKLGRENIIDLTNSEE